MDNVILELITQMGRENFEKKLQSFVFLKTDQQRFTEALDVLSTYNVIPEYKCQLKDVKESVELKNKANRIFLSNKDDEQELIKAWTLYTKSIVMAPAMSEELSVSYANRSAVLMHMHKYKESLEDIDRALSTNYPNHLKGKLLFRKSDCLSRLKEIEVKNALAEIGDWLASVNLSSTDKKAYEDKLAGMSSNGSAFTSDFTADETQSLPKLARPHKSVPCASDAVEVRHNKKFGKHLVANRKINVGEILIVEKPYASVLYPEEIYNHCAHCLQMAWAAVPCEHCVYAIYCSESCKNAAWAQCHDVECPVNGYFLNLSLHQRSFLALRTTILAARQAGSFGQLKKYIEKIEKCPDPLKKIFADDGVFHNERYETIYTLETHAEKRNGPDVFEIALHAAFISYYLYTKTNFFENPKTNCDLKSMSMNKDVIFIGGLILRHLQIIPVNTVMHYENTAYYDIRVIGSSLAGFLSLINHSCSANVTLISAKGGLAGMYAVLPIDKGSQIFYNYGCHFCNMPVSARQNHLKYQFYFDCKCDACVQGAPWMAPLSSTRLMQMNSTACGLTSSLIDKCLFYKMCLRRSTTEEKLKAVTDLCGKIELLVEHLSPISDKTALAVETLQNYFDAIYGVMYKIPDLGLRL